MMLENARLVAELHASRARLAEAGDRERRKLERDLHDGAQQRLTGDPDPAGLVAGTRRQTGSWPTTSTRSATTPPKRSRSCAVGSRHLSAVLRDYGLVDALRWFGHTAPGSRSIRDDGIGRCSRTIEAAIYFCAMEAVQNATKHAGSHARVTITLGRDRERVRFAVADDGVGMDP